MALGGVLGEAVLYVSAKVDGLIAGLQKGAAGVRDFGQKISAAGRTLTSLGQQAAMVSATIAGMFAPIIIQGATFEKTMSGVKAVVSDLKTGTDEAAKSFAALNDRAKQLGATTRFSASEVAEAMQFLGVAGFGTHQILMGIESTLELAAAGMLDLGRAADIASDTMTAFGISAANIGRVADVMAVTAMHANTNIEMLGESFKYVSPIAAALGQNIEEVSVALGLLANAGIKGSVSGAGLSQVFGQMVAKADKVNEVLAKYGASFADVNPEVNKLTDIIRVFAQLNVSAADMTELFGMRAGRTLIALANTGEAAMSKLQDAVENNFGAALEAAGYRAENVAGTFKTLQSRLEGLSITIFEQIQASLQDILNSAIDWIDKIQIWIKQNEELVQQFTLIAAKVAGITAAFAAVAIPVGIVVSAVAAVATAVAALGAVVAGPLAGAFSAGIGAIGSFVAMITNIPALLTGMVGGFTSLMGTLTGLSGAFTAMSGVVAGTTTVLGGLASAVGALIGGAVLGALIATLLSIKESWEEVKQAFYAGYHSVIKPVVEGFMVVLKGMWENVVKPAWEAMVDATKRLWTSIKELFLALEPLEPVFNALGAAVALLVSGPIALFIATLAVLTEAVNQIVKLITGAIDLFIEAGRAIGLLGDETETSAERAKRYGEELDSLADKTQKLLNATRELHEERKKRIGSDREMLTLVKKVAEGTASLTEQEELMNQLAETGASSLSHLMGLRLSQMKKTQREASMIQRQIDEIRKRGGTPSADLLRHHRELEKAYNTEKSHYEQMGDLIKVARERTGEKYTFDVHVMKHMIGLEKERIALTKEAEKAMERSAARQSELAKLRKELAEEYLEGTKKEIADIEKRRDVQHEMIQGEIADNKSRVELLKALEEGLLEAREKGLRAEKQANKLIAANREEQQRLLEANVELAQMEADLLKKKEEEKQRILQKQQSEQNRFLQQERLSQARREGDLRRVAELEIQILKENQKKKFDELGLEGEKRKEAEKLLANQVASIQKDAEEAILKEKQKKFKEADKLGKIEDKAAENVAKQVQNVHQLVALYATLHRIRMHQESIATTAIEKSLKAEQRLANITKAAQADPGNKLLENRKKQLEVETKLAKAIADKRAAQAGIFLPEDKGEAPAGGLEDAEASVTAFKDRVGEKLDALGGMFDTFGEKIGKAGDVVATLAGADFAGALDSEKLNRAFTEFDTVLAEIMDKLEELKLEGLIQDTDLVYEKFKDLVDVAAELQTVLGDEGIASRMGLEQFLANSGKLKAALSEIVAIVERAGKGPMGAAVEAAEGTEGVKAAKEAVGPVALFSESLLDEQILQQKFEEVSALVDKMSDTVDREFQHVTEQFALAPGRWVDAFVNAWTESAKNLVSAVQTTVAEVKKEMDPHTKHSPSLVDVWRMNTSVVRDGVSQISAMLQKSLPTLHQMDFGNVTVPKSVPMSTAGMQPVQRINQMNDSRRVDMTVHNNMDAVNLQRQIGNSLARAAMNAGQM